LLLLATPCYSLLLLTTPYCLLPSQLGPDALHLTTDNLLLTTYSLLLLTTPCYSLLLLTTPYYSLLLTTVPARPRRTASYFQLLTTYH
jgi:hypothetical protein